MKKVMILSVVMILAAGAAWAQQGGGPQVNTTAAFTVLGPVVSFTAARGAGHPVLTVDDASRGNVGLAVAPLWFLEEKGFSAHPGDQVEALVYPCSGCPVDGVAGSVKNLTLGTSVELRNGEGYPLWSGPRRRGNQAGTVNGEQSGGRARGMGAAAGRGAGCAGPDMSQAETLSGKVTAFSGGPGEGLPTVTLDVGGSSREIVVGPFHALAASGLKLEPGQDLTVTVAPSPQGHLVAVSVVDPVTGATLQLRDPETGRPLMGRHHGRGMGRARGAGPGSGPGSGDCPYRN